MCQIFLVMMKLVKVEENMVTAASQSTKKSLWFLWKAEWLILQVWGTGTTHGGLSDLCEHVLESLLALLAPYLDGISHWSFLS